MFKKLLHLYNDGHNPFPHIRGGALEETDEGGYRYDMNDDDDNIYLPNEEGREGGRPTGDWYERDGDKFIIHPRHGDDYVLYYNKETGTFNYDAPEGEEPDIINVSQEPLEYLEYDDDDVDKFEKELTQSINQGKSRVNYNELSLKDKYKTLEEILESLQNQLTITIPIKKKLKSDIEKIMEDIDDKIIQIGKDIIRSSMISEAKRLEHQENSNKLIKLFNLLTKDITEKNYNNPEKVNETVSILKKSPPSKLIDLLAAVSFNKARTNETNTIPVNYIKRIIYSIINPDYTVLMNKYNAIIKTVNTITKKYNEIKSESDLIEPKIKEQETQEKKQHKKETKLKHETKQEQAARELKEKIQKQQASAEDIKEIEAEQKQKTEATLSKAALKKQKAKEAKAAKEEAEAKAEEKQVELAKAGTKIVGKYGKKLEEFLTSKQGSPLLHKISNDDSKVYDNEFNPNIPNIDVEFNDGSTGPLSKACTLDLYNDTYVFEIKNYSENSIKDKVIPLQGSKLEGTGYFNPLYLENGELYNLELTYTDPNTGEKITKFILPENPNGRTLVIVVRLKEGLFQYKPMMDTEHVNLIPLVKKVVVKGKETNIPVITPEKKQLYVFDNTTLKPCKDYNNKSGSYNIQPYLKPI